MVRISWEHFENNKNPTTPISPKNSMGTLVGFARFINEIQT